MGSSRESLASMGATGGQTGGPRPYFSSREAAVGEHLAARLAAGAVVTS